MSDDNDIGWDARPKISRKDLSWSPFILLGGRRRVEKRKVRSAIRRFCFLYLDNYYPDWWNKVDLETLDMASFSRCVGGQLEDKSFARFVRRAEPRLINLNLLYEAFCPYVELESYAQRQWTRQIRSRRRSEAIGNFKDKLVSLFKRH